MRTSPAFIFPQSNLILMKTKARQHYTDTRMMALLKIDRIEHGQEGGAYSVHFGKGSRDWGTLFSGDWEGAWGCGLGYLGAGKFPSMDLGRGGGNHTGVFNPQALIQVHTSSSACLLENGPCCPCHRPTPIALVTLGPARLTRFLQDLVTI